MLAKAGESDRAIRVKMVRFAFVFYFGNFIQVLPCPIFGCWTLGVGAFCHFYFSVSIFDANMTFIIAFLHDFFQPKHLFAGKRKGRQDQPPIRHAYPLGISGGGITSTVYPPQHYTVSVCCTLFHIHFMTEHAHSAFIITRAIFTDKS